MLHCVWVSMAAVRLALMSSPFPALVEGLLGAGPSGIHHHEMDMGYPRQSTCHALGQLTHKLRTEVQR